MVGVCDCEKPLTVNNKLIKAAKLHHVKCLKSCLEGGADINAKKMGKTALDCLAKTKEEKHFTTRRYFNWNFLYFHLDVAECRHECIHVLLEAGADVKHHTSLLTVASLVGCEDCVHLLLKAGVGVDSDGLTLFVTAQGGHDKCLKLLLEAGANVNLQYAFNYTLLMVASSLKTNDCANILIQAGADVNARDVYLQTPLFHALHHGALECLETLVRTGADVNVQCYTGETPTIVAVNFGYDKSLEVLVNAGADVNIRAWGGYTALMKASEFGRTACVDLLLSAGADVNRCSIPEGRTALQFARGSCCIKSLLDAGADVNEPGPYGSTALMHAVCDGNTDSMKVLIKAGADVNATVCYRGETLCYGVTALHHSYLLIKDVSSVRKHLLGIKLLLLAGAKVNMFHSKGGNALFTGRNEVLAKVIFLHVCVILFTGGGFLQILGGGVCPKFSGGVSAPNFRGGCLLQIFGGGVCPKFSGGVSAPNFRGGVSAPNFRGGCLLQIFGGGVCSKFSGGGSSNFRNTVTVRPVRILLECILVECCVYNHADKRKEQIKLLFAAGEKIQSDEVMKAVQDCGFMEPPQETSLMNITRCAIREHLLKLDPHTHLFGRVPRLGLPAALAHCLLYDQTLDEGDDENNGDDDDDNGIVS